jgi:hypothetical protein
MVQTMNNADLAEKTVELIERLVGLPGLTWTQKRQLVIDACGGEVSANVEEFASWFGVS